MHKCMSKGNRGQCAFYFIFIKTNWWQVDCGCDLREKGQSHILTYLKLRNPSSTGTSAIHHLKNLPFESTNCRHANSPQPEGAELYVSKHFKITSLHWTTPAQRSNLRGQQIIDISASGNAPKTDFRQDREDRNCPSRTWLRWLGGLCATSWASV